MNKQLLAAAIAVFDTYPEAETVLVCEDGNVFLAERRNLADNHCREAKLPAPVEVTRERAEAWSKAHATVTEVIDNANARKAAAEAAAEEAEEQASAEAAAEEAEEKAAAEAAAKEAEEQADAELRDLDRSELPTTPGYYADKDGVHWLLNEDGSWSWKTSGAGIDRGGNEDMKAFAPFTAIKEPKSKGDGKKGARK